MNQCLQNLRLMEENIIPCWLKSDGTLWAWGGNIAGQLGDGTTDSRNSPIQIGDDNKWVAVSSRTLSQPRPQVGWNALGLGGEYRWSIR